MLSTKILVLGAHFASRVLANLSVKDHTSTTTSANTIAGNLMSYYDPASNGVLAQPYWWWESGAMWNTMLRYSHYSGDKQYDTHISAAITAQAGPGRDFMGPSTTGNDDQLWWGLTCVAAAEFGFAASPSGPNWLQLAQNVFNDVSGRWDDGTCGGGIGWQISSSAPGFHYKNSISNGLAFQLAARLAAFTKDDKYAAFAEKVFDWTFKVGLIDNKSYSVYDGTDALKECVDVNHDKWSYNVGVFLYGSAVMLTHTGNSAKWQPHLDGFISAIAADFSANGVLAEGCEGKIGAGACNTDQLSFKAYLARWMAATVDLVPSAADKISPLLQASVDGALASCNGSPGKDVCGTQWTLGHFDGVVGVGQQMAALEITQANLSGKAKKRSVGRPFVG